MWLLSSSLDCCWLQVRGAGEQHGAALLLHGPGGAGAGHAGAALPPERRDGGPALPHLGPRHPVRQGDRLQLQALGRQTARAALQVLLPLGLPADDGDTAPVVWRIVSFQFVIFYPIHDKHF